jgi:hypothetical protein
MDGGHEASRKSGNGPMTYQVVSAEQIEWIQRLTDKARIGNPVGLRKPESSLMLP